MEQNRKFDIFAAVLAAINTIIVLTVGLLLLERSSALSSIVQPELLAGFGIIGGLYYASVHQLLRRRRNRLSTLLLAAITQANFILVIIQTGGLGSPFYPLWLLAIIASGIFGATYSTTLAAGTLAAYAWHVRINHWQTSSLEAVLPQLVITVLAGGLAWWAYYRRDNTSQTNIKQLSHKLSQEQIKAQALLGSMTDGVLVVDAAGNITLVNKAAQAMTGWDQSTAAQIAYTAVLKLHGAKTDQAFDDPIRKSLSSGQPVVSNNVYLTTPAGNTVSLSMSVSPMLEAGHLTGVIAVFRDNSKEKQAERQRSEFVSTASHEMRTPVAAIEGYLSLALNPKLATIDERAHGYLQKAHDSTQHLGALFRDLLTVSKLEDGLATTRRVPVNISELINGVVDDMQFSAKARSLTLALAGQGGASSRTLLPMYYVSGDPERLREVVMNLIENAIKYTASGGITVSVGGDSEKVIVSVRDTGPGIAAEYLPHLFQKFYRVDNGATRTTAGTGLGLYLCRTIIELFGGQIWAESKLGHGSAFNFSLPRIKPETVPVDSIAAAPVKTKPAPASGLASGAKA